MISETIISQKRVGNFEENRQSATFIGIGPWHLFKVLQCNQIKKQAKSILIFDFGDQILRSGFRTLAKMFSPLRKKSCPSGGKEIPT